MCSLYLGDKYIRKKGLRFSTDFILDRFFSVAVRETLYYISTESLVFNFPLLLHQELAVNGRVYVEGKD
jgi:hypothetical protein